MKLVLFAQGNARKLVLAMLTVALCAVLGAQEAASKVLVLHAYHQGYQWTDSIHNAIAATLNSESNVDLYIEYMDTKRHPGAENIALLEELYKDRYSDRGVHFDAIFCCDDNALNFLLARRDSLFPGVPIVFCGINNLTPERLEGVTDITGVNEALSVRGTIDIALKLRPHARRMGVICDVVLSGRRNLELIQRLAPYYEDRIEFVWLDSLEVDELKEQLATFSSEDILLRASYSLTPSGQVLTSDESVRTIVNASDAALFGFWDYVMGPGTLGGKVLSGEAQGATAARMVLRVLAGEDVNDIPLVLESPNVYTFDYVQLERFGISTRLLPQGSVIIHEPPHTWRHYWPWFLGGLVFIVLESLLIIMFIVGRYRRTLLETDLRSSESRYRNLFNSIRDGVLVINADRKMTQINPAFQKMFGYTLRDIEGKSSRMIYNDEAEHERMGEVLRHVAKEDYHLYEARLRRATGELFDAEVHISRLYDQQGNCDGYMGTIRDVTDRKRAENDRIEMERQIQQTQRLESLGVLAGGIAHDFNNILMAVLGYSELALDQLTPLSPARHNIQEIGVAAHRAAELCSQMLAYSGKSSISRQRVNLHDLIDEIAHLLKTSITKKAVLNLHLERNLPDIIADPSQIRQVVMNLIINASDAIGDRSGVITIQAGATRCDEDYLRQTELHQDLDPGLYVHLEVVDTGCGMDAETRSRIFEPFFTTKFTGRGLGLAAVMGIIRAHKGALKVYSEPGKGTTFKILFAAAEPQQEEIVAATSGHTNWKGSGTVLLADDEESLRAMGASLLERLGFSVITARDGREALDIYQARRSEISLVLLDLTMPHLDGIQCFGELRRVDPSVRVIISSGYSKEDVASRFQGKRLDGVLQKPFTMQALRDTLRAIFEA